jgi:hypothetical protein
MVGVVVGIAKFATLSDGAVFEPVNRFKQKQRRPVRRTRGSAGWGKAKQSVRWRDISGTAPTCAGMWCAAIVGGEVCSEREEAVQDHKEQGREGSVRTGCRDATNVW